MTKEEIIHTAKDTFTGFTETCNGIGEKEFFEHPPGKWSVAENIQHLILATNTASLAYALPKFLVKWIGGKPISHSGTFDELLARYNKKLEDGGRASSRYVPKPSEVKFGKTMLLANWTKATTKFIRALAKNRTENDLDHYQVKHPLLGTITLRELCYFTIFHTRHHLQSIEKRMAL